ncbi:MAG: hypothetical protein MJ072_00985, partial [Clostridia bacterium]|nr:hypothetical protein [Clostridia bacterium]
MDPYKIFGVYANENALRAKTLSEKVKDRIKVKTLEIGNVLYKPCDYKSGTVMPVIDESFRPFEVGKERWGGKRDFHAWFYSKVVFPEVNSNERLEFSARTAKDGWASENPQFILYVDGKIVSGMDTNHTSVPVSFRGEHDVYLYAYSGTKIDDLLDLDIGFNVIDVDAEKLYYDLYVPVQVLEFTEPH